MLYQFSKNVDEKLHKLSRDISVAEQQIDEGTQAKDKAWEEVVNYFNEMADNVPSPKFIASNGRTLFYVKKEGTPKLDEVMFQALLYQRFEKREANKFWNSVTKRVLDYTALEAAVRTQKIPPELVEECMTPAKASYSRTHPEWSKEDRERAKIFGLEKE